jgi:nucleotide-binding universal stress UspA family protein
MINHILAPLDGSSLAECVLPHVVATARAFDARVTLLRVLDEMTAEGAVPISPVNWHLVRARGERYLEDVAQRLRELGCQVEAVLQEGKAAEEIISYADRNAVDMTILSSHGRSGLYRWNSSSVAQKVIFEAKTSVLIVRAYRAMDVAPGSLRYQKILVPLDCSRRAECVLPVASMMAQSAEGTLLLAHVVVPPQLPRRAPLTDHERQLVAEVVELNIRTAEEYLDELHEGLGVKSETRLLSEPDAAGALHDLVDAEAPDLVVVCAHGHTGARRWPFASLALNLIVYGSSPLLVVQDLPASEQHTSWVDATKEIKGH